MNYFDSLSHGPGYSLDIVTGEVQSLDTLVQSVKGDVGTFVSQQFDRGVIDFTRQITGELGEQAVCSVLGGRRIRTKNNKGFDIILNDGKKIEVKTGRIRNVAVIRNTQLDFMDKDGYFCFVFYRTTGNVAPSSFVSKSDGKYKGTKLKRNMSIESIVLLPHPAVVFYYNTSKLNEREIGKSGVKYKPLGLTNAKGIFNQNPGNFEKFECEKVFGKHKIKVLSLGLEVI